jgi:hypothetical protein
MNERRLVHVRIVKEDKLFAAQCLEYDICAQGDSPVKALEVWRITAMGQVALDKKRGREPLAAIPCAPISLWCGDPARQSHRRLLRRVNEGRGAEE